MVQPMQEGLGTPLLVRRDPSTALWEQRSSWKTETLSLLKGEISTLFVVMAPHIGSPNILTCRKQKLSCRMADRVPVSPRISKPLLESQEHMNATPALDTPGFPSRLHTCSPNATQALGDSVFSSEKWGTQTNFIRKAAARDKGNHARDTQDT